MLHKAKEFQVCKSNGKMSRVLGVNENAKYLDFWTFWTHNCAACKIKIKNIRMRVILDLQHMRRVAMCKERAWNGAKWSPQFKSIIDLNCYRSIPHMAMNTYAHTQSSFFFCISFNPNSSSQVYLQTTCIPALGCCRCYPSDFQLHFCCLLCFLPPLTVHLFPSKHIILLQMR